MHLDIAESCRDPVSRYYQAADVSRVQVLLRHNGEDRRSICNEVKKGTFFILR